VFPHWQIATSGMRAQGKHFDYARKQLLCEHKEWTRHRCTRTEQGEGALVLHQRAEAHVLKGQDFICLWEC
jgi:hypothetical protein